MLLEELLAFFGYTTESASSGLEALNKLTAEFDLVLLDVLMPGIDGFEVVRRIRENPQISDIPVIMVTILDDKDTRLRAVKLGVNDFVAKPIDSLEVRVRIESLLKMKEAQDAIKRHRAELEETVNKRTAALLESERRFKTLIETAHDGIFIKDRELRYTDVNAAMIKLLDKQLEDIIEKTDRELFGNHIAAQNKKVESRVLDGQTIETQETLLYKSLPIAVGCVRFPLWSPSHDIIGVCGIVREMPFNVEISSDDQSRLDDYPSEAMQYILAKARIAGDTDSTILLTGESGTGKDHLARNIHDRSLRSRGPFYALNCAAIPQELAESELFGHEAGAFTGAVRRKRGLLELAEGGTLLLNEIGELSHVLQSKLLTFLDTLSFTRVGGEKKITVNIRLIAATSRNLVTEVTESRFRKDLFYRLNIFPIHLPPLRERSEDIPILVTELVVRLASTIGLPNAPEVSPDALHLLERHSWPGNVRELRNILERALILSRGGPIRADHIVLGDSEEKSSRESPHPLARNAPLNTVVAETQRALIEEALKAANGKKQDAARLLGISRYAFARLLRKTGMTGGIRPK
jgi:DNA-binding NtrC family response regulator